MSNTKGEIVSLRAGKIVTIEGENKVFETAYFKKSTDLKLWLGKTGLDGDFQADKKYHGGSEKALLAYAASSYKMWKDKYGFNFENGSFGENITVDGLDEDSVCLGDIYKIGDVLIEVSQPRQPCWKINAALNDKEMLKNTLNEGRTGWYYRVLNEGYLQSDMTIELHKRINPDWSIKKANDVMKNKKSNPELVEQILKIAELSYEWKRDL